MFDALTLDDLYALHSKLCTEGSELHNRFMAQPSALSEDARLLQAKHAEVSETMSAVYAEIDRRDQEKPAGTRALRDLRNQRGIDA